MAALDLPREADEHLSELVVVGRLQPRGLGEVALVRVEARGEQEELRLELVEPVRCMKGDVGRCRGDEGGCREIGRRAQMSCGWDWYLPTSPLHLPYISSSLRSTPSSLQPWSRSVKLKPRVRATFTTLRCGGEAVPG